MLVQHDFLGGSAPVAEPRVAPSRPLGAPDVYPGASPALTPILAAIARLPRADQRALLQAFQAAIVPPKPARIAGRKTFRGWDDFAPALTAARLACAEVHGPGWHLNTAATLKARLPAAWVACHVFGRISRSPRDVSVPRAEFWPGGELPIGPDYAEFGPVASPGPETMPPPQAATPADAPAFDLELTPDEIDHPMLDTED